MKRLLSMVLCLPLLLLAGCSSASRLEDELYGTVTVGGSCAAEWYMSVLLEGFTFERNYTTVTYSPSSSYYGVEGIITGILDVGVATWLPEEMPDNIVVTPLAMEAIAVLVHEDNPVQAFTVEELRAIFSREITNWQALGGDDAEIILPGRKYTSGTRRNFEALVGAGSVEYDAVFSGSGAVAHAVGSDKYAIGFGSYVHYNSPIAYAEIEGALPGYETVKDGSYPLRQTFYMLTDENRAYSEAAVAFFDFFERAETGGLTKRTRAVALTPEGAVA